MLLGVGEIAKVTDMEHVEGAVDQNDGLALPPPALALVGEFGPGF